MIYLMMSLIIAAIWGYICLKMAEKRGREKWLGFLLGFLFGIFAMFGYLIAGDTSEKKAKIIADAINEKKE